MAVNIPLAGFKGAAAAPLRCMFLAITLVIALLMADSTAFCATNYVRAGATGANSGTDWNNAYTDLPASLRRGDTYYVADGDYGTHRFADDRSGTSIILIKKATTIDHGSNVGWQDSYGAGQAVFGPFSFAKPSTGYGGYYDVNGYSPVAIKNCGFKIATTWHQTSIHYGLGDTGHHPYCSWRYIEMAGPGGTGDYNSGDSPWLYGIYAHGNTGSAYDTTHMLVSHCYIHGITTPFQDAEGNNYMTVEYCDISNSREVGIDHGNIYWVGSSYGTFRYNRCHNYNVEGLFIGFSTVGWQIYGNVFYDGVAVARGIEFREPQAQRDMKIYNNTFVDLPLPAVRVMETSVTSGVEIKNNLLVNTGGIALQNGGGGVTLANNIATNTSVFVNYAARDFRLARAIGAGSPLPSPYDKDPEGNTRGVNGLWAVGAYEYASGATTNPVIQVSSTVMNFGPVTAGASATNSFTVYNAGAGTLSGMATVATTSTSFLQILSGGTYSLGGNQAQVVTVRYTPTANGTDSGSIICTGGGGAQVNVSGALLVVLPGLSFPSSAGIITAPFTASGGYVSQTVNASSIAEGGQAFYAFNVPTAGRYVISASVNAPNAGANSFYVNIDAQPTDPMMIWDAAVSTGFAEQLVSWRGNGGDGSNQFVPAVFDLTAGTHHLIVRGREAGIQLGNIKITPYSRPASPQGLRVVATNP